ncbi:MAG: HD-GYP domain-containing protein, partial [Acidimicrobiia bacterium]|nr:HD-GYP domain-containing protein [Acidimicrobiia bacterium]
MRVAIFLVPLAVGFAAGSFVGRGLPTPHNGWAVAGWWLLVVVTASIAATLTDRFSRRLLPMAVLLKMTMVFPDQAPSRLKVARRAGNISLLRRRASGEDGDTTLAESAEVILSLAAALSQHDRKTRGHSERTRAYTDMLAEEMSLSTDDRDRLRWAALLHDVGKLEVPAEILNKDGPLTPEDWAEIHHHPVYGMKLIAPLIPWLGPWAQTVEHHHEQWDGSGYPYGLTGSDIALGARIVAVADAYDVMTSGRSYQPAKTPAVTRREIAALAGKQFDPEVVRALMNVSLGKLRWATGPIAFLAEMPFIRGIPQFGRDAAVLLTSSAVIVTAATGAAPLPFDFDAPQFTSTTIVEDVGPPVAGGPV